MDKPERVELKECILCHRQQLWDPSGWVVTKGWHGIHLSTGSGKAQGNFGNRISLSYPDKGSNDVICTECLPKAMERYIEAMNIWS